MRILIFFYFLCCFFGCFRCGIIVGHHPLAFCCYRYSIPDIPSKCDGRRYISPTVITHNLWPTLCGSHKASEEYIALYCQLDSTLMSRSHLFPLFRFPNPLVCWRTRLVFFNEVSSGFFHRFDSFIHFDAAFSNIVHSWSQTRSMPWLGAYTVYRAGFICLTNLGSTVDWVWRGLDGSPGDIC